MTTVGGARIGDDIERHLAWGRGSTLLTRLNLFLFGGFGAKLQNFARLAIERFTDGFQRGETNGPRLASFEDGQVLRSDPDGVRQIIQPHFPLGEDHVQIYDDGHIGRKKYEV
jgi:hypothetical protein